MTVNIWSRDLTAVANSADSTVSWSAIFQSLRFYDIKRFPSLFQDAWVDNYLSALCTWNDAQHPVNITRSNASSRPAACHHVKALQI